MTQTKAKELLPVFAAYAEGKTVQWATKADGHWSDWYSECFAVNHEPMIFLNPRFRWRVKPEAREWWVCPQCGSAFRDNHVVCPATWECVARLVRAREVLK